MSNIQIRIDEKDKLAAKRVLDRLGLDMSSAVKLFLKQTALRKGLPFMLLTENGMSVEEETAILKAASRARKNISKAMEADEAVKHLRRK